MDMLVIFSIIFLSSYIDSLKYSYKQKSLIIFFVSITISILEIIYIKDFYFVSFLVNILTGQLVLGLSYIIAKHGNFEIFRRPKNDKDKN